MLRTKDRFYWSDALYLAKGRDEVVELAQSGGLFRCIACSALFRFSERWSRIKPFEYFQLSKHRDSSLMNIEKMELVRVKGAQSLYQCACCKSFWWNEGGAWNKADDEIVEKEK